MLNKLKLGLVTQSLCIALFAANAQAGVIESCFGGTLEPGDKISASDLKNKASKEGFKGVCYTTSLCYAKLEGGITQSGEDLILKVGSNYTPDYLELMDMSDATLKSSLSINGIDGDSLLISDIDESGVINFKRKESKPLLNDYTHTIYVQSTKGGKLYMYSNNSSDFDVAMAGLFSKEDVIVDPREAVKMRAGSRHLVDEAFVDRFNEYLAHSDFDFFYTPNSKIRANVAAYDPNVVVPINNGV
jgi:hypothetical protein